MDNQNRIKATAIANANVALVKYWGKRDKDLLLPKNGSISVTLDGVSAKTTVEFSKKYKENIFILNGKRVKKDSKEQKEYIDDFLNKIKKLTNNKLKAKIVSKNNFVSGSGLASSAAGFAALTGAINKALNLGFGNKKLSILARLGSGSATRSVFGGFVEWQKGKKKDGSDSFAKQIADDSFWPEFRIVACITSKEEKKIKSRAGMEQTILTSPFYNAWLKTIDKDLKDVRDGLIKKNFSKVGRVAEENCLKMHSLMMSTKPSIIYFEPGTIEVIHNVLS